MSSPTNEELLSAVESAGWLLEQHALRILKEHEVHPRSGWAYQDADDPSVSRELDVWAYKQMLRDEANKIIVGVKFLVECKQSSQPYAAIGHVLPEYHLQRNPTQHVLPVQNFPVQREGNTTTYAPAWGALGFDNVALGHGEDHFRATQLTRLDRVKGGGWSANNNGIFTSLVYPLAKALRATQKGAVTTEYYSGIAGHRDKWVMVDLCFPVVLISADLFVVDASADTPEVAKKPWVTTRRELKSRSVNGVFDIDVVTSESFADFVRAKLAFSAAIADEVGKDPRRCVGDEWVA
ncbi:hypothetical protein [Arthrobacter sp. NtRootA1]|uniref:hypothetical protein n=1 Tax=Arthrobacter sp. NtRootA1 TaxID=2830983 RepID=UPI001CC45DAA|nr:hypothetical protein [Arthrobacter sp. NtRootA1]